MIKAQFLCFYIIITQLHVCRSSDQSGAPVQIILHVWDLCNGKFLFKTLTTFPSHFLYTFVAKVPWYLQSMDIRIHQVVLRYLKMHYIKCPGTYIQYQVVIFLLLHHRTKWHTIPPLHLRFESCNFIISIEQINKDNLQSRLQISWNNQIVKYLNTGISEYAITLLVLKSRHRCAYFL